MNSLHGFFALTELVMLLASFTTFASFISDDVLQGYVSASSNLLQAKESDALHDYGSTGRSLLQAKKNCHLNFEFMNYTIMTSKCKGPQYEADLCCPALKEFACPYAEELNDQTNNCASAMFSYINLYGKYPPGLFASECREGKDGLDCMAYISKSNNSTSTSSAASSAGAGCSLFAALAAAPVFWMAALI